MMSMTDENNERTEYDDRIDDAIEDLISPETEGFWLATISEDLRVTNTIGTDKWENGRASEEVDKIEALPPVLAANMIVGLASHYNIDVRTAMEMVGEIVTRDIDTNEENDT